MSKTILITGASRGLGLNLTKKYLQDGETVFAGIRDTANHALKPLLEEYPDTLIPLVLEVTDTKSVQEAAVMVGKYTKSLDIVINNAAIHSQSSFEVLEDTDIDDCLPVYNVNSLGPLRIVKVFIPFLKNSTSAKIINISSESGSLGACTREKEFDYCMSKTALNMGTKLLANYLRKDKIVVLAVHPGWMRTDMGGSNADLDPYETACKLVEMFENISSTETPIFIDNKGDAFIW
jgi:NAD(P)-dependent dehydrogenase (short-subunit alcohol dehydrogenase family)